MPELATPRRTYHVLDDAAALCRLLAAVEHAHLVGDEDLLDKLLTQVVEIDCARVAEELGAMAGVQREAHARHRRALLQASPPQSPPETGASAEPDQRPLAPVLPLDPHSRRVK